MADNKGHLLQNKLSLTSIANNLGYKHSLPHQHGFQLGLVDMVYLTNMLTTRTHGHGFPQQQGYQPEHMNRVYLTNKARNPEIKS
jgi:hypothetical protein